MMSMPTVNISAVSGLLSVDSTPARINISGQNPTIDIQNTPAKLDVYTKDATVEVHNYPVYKQLGMKNMTDFTFDNAAEAKQDGYKAIGEYADIGDQMMQIENKQDPVPDIAMRNAEIFKSGSTINVGYFPENGPDISVKEGGVSGNFQPGEIKVEKTNKMNIEVEPGKFSVNLERYPKIEMSVVGGNVNYVV